MCVWMSHESFWLGVIVGGNRCHHNITFHLILFGCISGFSCISKRQGLFTGRDDLAGACQKSPLFEKKTLSFGITVSQDSVFLIVKCKSLIAVCGFTSKLSLFVSVSAGSQAASAASTGLGASHRVPQKNKWVSCLSIVRYWVSGQECSQCAKVGGRGECSLVFLTWWDELREGGSEESCLIFFP